MATPRFAARMNASSSCDLGGTGLGLDARHRQARDWSALAEEDAERVDDGADARGVEPRAAEPDAVDAADRVRRRP